MKANGYFEVSDVPCLVKRGDVASMVTARGALLDACEEIAEDCEKTGRSMTPEERTRFDEFAAWASEITGDLTEYKRNRLANNDSGLQVNIPF